MLFPSLSPLALRGGASDHWEQSKRVVPPQPRLSLVSPLRRAAGPPSSAPQATRRLRTYLGEKLRRACAPQRETFVWRKIRLRKRKHCASSQFGCSYSRQVCRGAGGPSVGGRRPVMRSPRSGEGLGRDRSTWLPPAPGWRVERSPRAPFSGPVPVLGRMSREKEIAALSF